MKKRIIAILIFIVLITACEAKKVSSTVKSIYIDSLYKLGLKELTPGVYISWYRLPRMAGPIVICSKNFTKSELRYLFRNNSFRTAYGEQYLVSEYDLTQLQTFIDRADNCKNKLDDSTYSFSVTVVNKGTIKRASFSASDMFPVWKTIGSFSKDKYLDLYDLSLSFEDDINRHNKLMLE